MKTTREKIEAFRKKRMELIDGSGESGAKKQHEKGKLTARERVRLFCNPDTWQELNLFSEHRAINFGMQGKDIPADGVITGVTTVDNKLVYIVSQDFTAAGGSVGEVHAAKICAVMDMALKSGAPVLMFNDSGGARIQEGVDSLNGYGNIFYRNTLLSGVVPQIAIISGPCAGGAAYSPALMDFIIMVRGTGQLYITGPQVIKEVTGEDISAEALGGADVNASISGNIHFIASSDEEADLIARKLLSFLPSNNLEEAPRYGDGTLSWSEDNYLNTIIPDDPREAYNILDVIHHIVDNRDFLEVKAHFAGNLIVGFGRINGETVGIVANAPAVKAGVLDIDASDKGAEFIRFCNVFNIPIVTLVDVPGFLPGIEQEHRGIIRHGAKMLFSYASTTSPKITVVLRKAYGGAYLAMCSKSVGADRIAAWPTAEIAVMGAAGAANIIFRDEIKNAKDPKAEKKAKIEEYDNKFSNPYQAAARGMVDAVIEPKDTRRYITLALISLKNKRDIRPQKKHGLIPM